MATQSSDVLTDSPGEPLKARTEAIYTAQFQPSHAGDYTLRYQVSKRGYKDYFFTDNLYCRWQVPAPPGPQDRRMENASPASRSTRPRRRGGIALE